MTAPCKGCSFRHLACHDSCAKYLDWKQKREAYLASQHNDTMQDYLNKKRRRRI